MFNLIEPCGKYRSVCKLNEQWTKKKDYLNDAWNNEIMTKWNLGCINSETWCDKTLKQFWNSGNSGTKWHIYVPCSQHGDEQSKNV